MVAELTLIVALVGAGVPLLACASFVSNVQLSIDYSHVLGKELTPIYLGNAQPMPRVPLGSES